MKSERHCTTELEMLCLMYFINAYFFRWARWDEIVDKNQFRKGWTQPVIEDCARIIVSGCYYLKIPRNFCE